MQLRERLMLDDIERAATLYAERGATDVEDFPEHIYLFVRLNWVEHSPIHKLPLAEGGLLDQPYWLTLVLERIAFTFQYIDNKKVTEDEVKRKREAIFQQQLDTLLGFTGASIGIK